MMMRLGPSRSSLWAVVKRLELGAGGVRDASWSNVCVCARVGGLSSLVMGRAARLEHNLSFFFPLGYVFH